MAIQLYLQVRESQTQSDESHSLTPIPLPFASQLSALTSHVSRRALSRRYARHAKVLQRLLVVTGVLWPS